MQEYRVTAEFDIGAINEAEASGLLAALVAHAGRNFAVRGSKILATLPIVHETPLRRVPVDDIGIRPVDPPLTYSRTGSLSGLDEAGIATILGFHAIVPVSLDEKKTREWWFSYRGSILGIWDYRGSALERLWSTSGPDELFFEIFGQRYAGDRTW